MKGSRPRGHSRFQRIGLVAKMSPTALRLTAALARALSRRGLQVIFDGKTARAMGKKSEGVPRDRIARLADLVLVLG